MTSGHRNHLGMLLGTLWFVSSGVLLLSSALGRSQLSAYGNVASLVFILILIVYLWRAPPLAADLPDLESLADLHLGYGKMLLMILGGLVVLFLVGIVVHPWIVLVAALSLVACTVVIAQRRSLSRRLIFLGLLAGGLCLILSGMSGRLDGFQGFYLACVPLLFVGGGLLTKRTGLTRVHSVDGNWGLAIRGFLSACVLSVPAALLNISYGAHPADAWVDQVWEPAVALVPGIAEETWARLFLLTLLYALLRPQTKQRPARAMVTPVLLAALVHALAHLPGTMVFSPAALQMLLSGLLFGVPMGLLFVKYGFEQAVGYHFFIDFVRFVLAVQQG
ncbi:MAG: hypothetical protein AAFY78_20615 [Cyanobacteria bacterium J06648_16]